MSHYVVEQKLDRSGAVIEQTVAVDLDPVDVIRLLPELEHVRHVSLSVKYRQVKVGEYEPATARAYVTTGGGP